MKPTTSKTPLPAKPPICARGETRGCERPAWYASSRGGQCGGCQHGTRRGRTHLHRDVKPGVLLEGEEPRQGRADVGRHKDDK